MTITEVMPIIETLPHADKFKLMQFLLSLLAKDEGIVLPTEFTRMETTASQSDEAFTDPINTTKDNPFCGMWKDRDDMANVENYVRQLRQGRQF
jgi:hypothetical protein